MTNDLALPPYATPAYDVGLVQFLHPSLHVMEKQRGPGDVIESAALMLAVTLARRDTRVALRMRACLLGLFLSPHHNPAHRGTRRATIFTLLIFSCRQYVLRFGESQDEFIVGTRFVEWLIG